MRVDAAEEGVALLLGLGSTGTTRDQCLGAATQCVPAGTPYAEATSPAPDDRRCPVYWLLLPVEANAQRHLADETEPSDGFWARLWVTLQRTLSGAPNA